MKSGRILFLSLPIVWTFACSDDANLGNDQGQTPVSGGQDAAASQTSSDDDTPGSQPTASEDQNDASDPDPTPADETDTDETDAPPDTTSDPDATEPSDEPVTDPDPTTDPPPVGAADAGSTQSTDEPQPVSDAGSSSDNSDPAPECAQVQCFRAVECVETCGGPVLASGCCPCEEGTFDSIECTVDPEPLVDAGTEADAGADYTLEDLGTACVDDACPRGLTATHYFGIAGPAGPEFCSCEIPCGEDESVCPEGSSCATISDGPGSVCIAQPDN